MMRQVVLRSYEVRRYDAHISIRNESFRYPNANPDTNPKPNPYSALYHPTST